MGTATNQEQIEKNHWLRFWRNNLRSLGQQRKRTVKSDMWMDLKIYWRKAVYQIDRRCLRLLEGTLGW